MITPAQIRDKALRIYHTRFLAADARGISLFPLEIPADRGRTTDDFERRFQELDALMSQEKSATGFGYTVEFRSVNTRRHGVQSVPARLYFEDRDDFLRFIRKTGENQAFRKNLALIVSRLPALEPWCQANARKIVEFQDDWEGLIRVCEHFLRHPVSGLYIRELPIEVDTKFIERRTRILKSLLDALLPEERILQSESRFERRYGLNVKPGLVRFRILDPGLMASAGIAFSDLSVRIDEFGSGLPGLDTVYVVENEINFLTFPKLHRSIVIWGKGFALEELRGLSWLSDCRVVYWGDIDAAGFRILSLLRSICPQTASMLMDTTTWKAYQDQAVPDPNPGSAVPAGLSPSERALAEILIENPDQSRLEQEKIHHAYLLKALNL